MNLGLGSYAYRWSIGLHDKRPALPMTPLALLHKAVENQLSLVQYADNMPLHLIGNHDIRELSEEAQRDSVEIELATQGLSQPVLRQYIRLAEILTAKLIRLSLSAEDAKKPPDQLKRELEEVLHSCQPRGITLALENHFHTSSAALQTLLRDINHPALGICLDVANSLAIHERPEETVQALAPWARNVHLKDYAVELDPYGVGFRVVGKPLGQGQLDIAMVFEALRDHKRDVNIILEHWIYPAASPEECLQVEDEWVRQSVKVAKRFVNAYTF